LSISSVNWLINWFDFVSKICWVKFWRIHSIFVDCLISEERDNWSLKKRMFRKFLLNLKFYRFISSKLVFGICIWWNAKARKEFFSLSISSNDKLKEINGLTKDLLLLLICELCRESRGFQEIFFKLKFSWRFFENSSTKDWDCSWS